MDFSNDIAILIVLMPIFNITEKNEMVIKEISSKETYAVRHPVLRPGRPIEDCFFEYDDDSSSIHLALEMQGRIVSVLSAMPIQCSYFLEFKAMRLRGIATLEGHQKQGYGSKLLKFAEALLKAKGIELLWLNSRVKASEFYKKLGYEPAGELFDIFGIGLHQTFIKSLKD